MIIGPKFCRLSPAAEPAVAAFATGCGPFRAVLCMVLPLAGTLFYFQYLHWSWQVAIPTVTIVAAPAAAWLAKGTELKALGRTLSEYLRLAIPDPVSTDAEATTTTVGVYNMLPVQDQTTVRTYRQQAQPPKHRLAHA